MNQTTILIVDDHMLVREAWSFILNDHPGFSVIGACGSGEEAIELARSLRPDIVLMDINLPGMSGIEATSLIRKCSPSSKILGVSMHTLPVYARKMILQGASGYISKSSHRGEMFYAIREVQRGRRYICQEIKDLISEQITGIDAAREALQSLTSRQLQIIARIAQGETSRQIGEALGLSVKTVEVHRYHILQKLNLKNSTSLVNFINQHRLELIT
jgi:two-component system invasion response regulator UvrY